MSFLAAAIVGSAVSTGFKAKANRDAKAEAKHSATMKGISNNISKYQMFANAAIQGQEMQDTFQSQESTATTVAAAQGRRSSSGSVKAISTERKNMLDKNLTRLKENAELTGALLDIGTVEAQREAAARNKAGDTALAADTAGTALSLISLAK